MDVKDAIEARRSIRKYQDSEVPDEVIGELLDAARLSPSGHNKQPWAYKVVREPEQRRSLEDERIFKQDFVYTAPLIIVCCANPDAYPRETEPDFDDPSEVRATRFATRAIRDLAISSQNLVLRATELGLGTCYVGLVDSDGIKPALGIPENYIVPYAITVGYADESPEPRPRKGIEDITL